MEKGLAEWKLRPLLSQQEAWIEEWGAISVRGGGHSDCHCGSKGWNDSGTRKLAAATHEVMVASEDAEEQVIEHVHSFKVHSENLEGV